MLMATYATCQAIGVLPFICGVCEGAWHISGGNSKRCGALYVGQRDMRQDDQAWAAGTACSSFMSCSHLSFSYCSGTLKSGSQ